jgi:hypothetical protein
MHTRTALIATVIVTLALGAAPARAAPYETMIQDDNVLVYGSDSDAAIGMGVLHNLGVDRARITVPWSLAAPRPNDRRKPRRFRPDQPDAYAPSAAKYRSTFIYRIDRAVRLGADHGVKVDLDIGFGAPRWAAAGFGSKDHFGAVNRPNPTEFARFARAMARRYSGRFAPLRQSSVLPQVDVFELWNEPNVPTFLQPQWENGVPAAADQYRALVQAAYPAMKAVNPGAKLLIGVTAPSGFTGGGATSPVAPIPFLRRLACVDARLRPVHDGGCRHFRRVPGDGVSHHPYALWSPPAIPSPDPNVVRIANIDRITRLTGRLVSRHRFAPATRDLWLTEFGYETNDPVRSKPWSLDQQSRLLSQAEYLSQRNIHVRSITQFLLRDVLTTAALRHAAGTGASPGPGRRGCTTRTSGPSRPPRRSRSRCCPSATARRCASSGTSGWTETAGCPSASKASSPTARGRRSTPAMPAAATAIRGSIRSRAASSSARSVPAIHPSRTATASRSRASAGSTASRSRFRI